MDHEYESALMRRIAAKDRDAFAEMMSHHMNNIFRFAYGITGDRALAEDMTQETYIRLWRNAGQWKPKGRVRSWLLRITHNLCMDSLRAMKPGVSIDALGDTLRSAAPDAGFLLHESQVSKIMKQALFELPERQRTALMLVHYSGCPQAEAADIMGISVDAFESLLARGKAGLRECLSGMKEELLEG
jgi:RNA polymerase sigma-70 factor, ECF subfamily